MSRYIFFSLCDCWHSLLSASPCHHYLKVRTELFTHKKLMVQSCPRCLNLVGWHIPTYHFYSLKKNCNCDRIMKRAFRSKKRTFYDKCMYKLSIQRQFLPRQILDLCTDPSTTNYGFLHRRSFNDIIGVRLEINVHTKK